MIFEYADLLIKGLIIGFVASIPLGPIGIICIQRTLSGGRNVGFVSGLGAATADTIFAMLAMFALGYIQSFIEDNSYWFQAIGGILVMLLGFSIYMKKVRRPSRDNNVKNSVSHIGNYFSTLALTLTNPAFFFVFLTLFFAFGIGDNMEISARLSLLIGVLVGASSWWFLLTWAVSKLRKKFTIRKLWWLNKISGAAIIVLGASAIIMMLLEITKIIE